MKFAVRLSAMAVAIAAVGSLSGCSSTSLGDGLGVKSAVSMLTPSSFKSAPGSTRGKRYRASDRERQCLARAMFFESNRSSRDGLVAVGSVVMNRHDDGRWGNDLCSVVGAKRQFAPGVLSRPMNSKALPDVMAAADSVLAGERHPKVQQNVMFFHTAGLRFPYKNMRYTVVAGGNSFYEKVSRRRKIDNLPAADPSPEPDVMVASAAPQPAGTDRIVTATPQMAAATAFVPAPKPVPTAQGEARQNAVVASASGRQPRLKWIPGAQAAAAQSAVPGSVAPDPARFAGAATFAPPPLAPGPSEPVYADASSADPVLSLEATPDQVTEVGQTILSQQEQ